MVLKVRLYLLTGKGYYDLKPSYVIAVECTDGSPLEFPCRAFCPHLSQINYQSNHRELQFIETMCHELFFNYWNGLTAPSRNPHQLSHRASLACMAFVNNWSRGQAGLLSCIKEVIPSVFGQSFGCNCFLYKVLALAIKTASSNLGTDMDKQIFLAKHTKLQCQKQQCH